MGNANKEIMSLAEVKAYHEACKPVTITAKKPSANKKSTIEYFQEKRKALAIEIEQASKSNRYRVFVDGKMVCRLTTTKKVVYIQPSAKMRTAEKMSKIEWEYHNGWDCPWVYTVDTFEDVKEFVAKYCI